MIIEKAKTLDEALELLAGGYIPAAGFTNVYVNVRKGKLDEKSLKCADISEIESLKGIKEYNGALCIGGAATFGEIADYLKFDYSGEFAALRMAAEAVGGPQTRNRGTIGGNIADASPSADSVPALMALDAKVSLMSKSGVRLVDMGSFFTGYRQTVLRPGELITAVLLYRRGGKSIYKKVGRRSALAIAVAGTALWLREEDGIIADASAAMSSVAPTAARLRAAERALRGQAMGEELYEKAAAAVAEDISPVDDIRATAEYRRLVSANLMAACLRELAEVKTFDFKL